MSPGCLIPAKPGEKGEYELLGLEGIDNDGDVARSTRTRPAAAT